MAKQRVHNEWFRPVSRGNRKSCTNCKSKLPHAESIWCWGEYRNAKWRSVQDFCHACWDDVRTKLLAHAGPCGCTFDLIGYRCGLPWWLNLRARTLPTLEECEAKLKTPSPRWAGACYGIACEIMDLFNLDARPRYGHWTGPVHRHSYFNPLRPFQRHGWLELWDGRIFDPTRWVFEQPSPVGNQSRVRPYLYAGPNDHYDYGGAKFLAERRQFPPPQWTNNGQRVSVSVLDSGLEAWLQRWFPQNSRSACVGGSTWWLTFDQCMWLANLPIEFLKHHELARPLYTALTVAGEAALIPMDFRDDVLPQWEVDLIAPKKSERVASARECVLT